MLFSIEIATASAFAPHGATKTKVNYIKLQTLIGTNTIDSCVHQKVDGYFGLPANPCKVKIATAMILLSCQITGYNCVTENHSVVKSRCAQMFFWTANFPNNMKKPKPLSKDLVVCY